MFLEIIEAKSNDITRENANMNTDSPAGMMMKFASGYGLTAVHLILSGFKRYAAYDTCSLDTFGRTRLTMSAPI